MLILHIFTKTSYLSATFLVYLQPCHHFLRYFEVFNQLVDVFRHYAEIPELFQL